MRQRNYERTRDGLFRKLQVEVARGQVPASQVASVFAAVRALFKLTNQQSDAESVVGKTTTLRDAVKVAMYLLNKPVSPTEIRDALVSLGYDLRRYSFPMAVIHSAIKVEINHDNVTVLRAHDGSKKYRLRSQT